MKRAPVHGSSRLKSALGMIDRLLRHFSLHMLPVAILVIAIITLSFDPKSNGFGPGTFHAIYMLEGSILTLSLTLFIFAIFSRKWLYVLFSAWLIANLRITALSMGWDIQWLGQTIPYEMLPRIRQTTIALYYLLSYSVFAQLFKTQLPKINLPRLQQIVLGCGIVLLVAAGLLSYDHFITLTWVLTGVGFAIVLFLLRRIVAIAASREAVWYSVTLAVIIAIGTGFFNTLASQFGFGFFNGTAIHVVAAYTTSALLAIVVAESVGNERRERLRAQTEELRSIYEVTPVGLFTLDAEGTFIGGNPALKRLLETISPSSRHDNWKDYFGSMSWITLKHLTLSQGTVEIEVQSIKTDYRHSTHTFLVKAVPSNGCIQGSLQDITGHVNTIARLHVLANHDRLTNALNQRGIESVLSTALNALNHAEPFSLAYLDLTSIDIVNDLYGYNAGDDVLIQACERIRSTLSDTQLLGRISGSEFVIIFQNTVIATAKATAQAALAALQETPYHISDTRTFQVRVSMGLVEITNPKTEPQAAILVAARACRRAKRSGSNKLVVHEHNARQLTEQSQEMQLLRVFSSGFSAEGLFLEMQPIMSLKKPLDSLNFEVLLRMRDASGALVPTPIIITAAEESGVVSELDHWVFSTTLRWLDIHRHQLSCTDFVCINLNGMSLNNLQFTQRFFETLAHYEHIAHMLCLEITESVALHDMENTRHFISRFQALGARIALDDFGAGYTSFSYLKELPADALKIDGSFIQNMCQDPASVAIVEAIVALARSLGMLSIAEWVEDEATLETLSRIGVDYVQGFVIARPQSPDHILAAANSSSFITDEQTSQLLQRLIS